MNQLNAHQDALGDYDGEVPMGVMQSVSEAASGKEMDLTFTALIVIIAVIVGICAGTWISLNCHREPVRYRVYGKSQSVEMEVTIAYFK